MSPHDPHAPRTLAEAGLGMREETVGAETWIGVGEPIDPATDPALCIACYLGEHDRCGPPCDCTHDGPPAPRDGRYVQDDVGVWWPRDDVGPRVEPYAGVSAVEAALDRLLDEFGADLSWQRTFAHAFIRGDRPVVLWPRRNSRPTLERVILQAFGIRRWAVDDHRRETPERRRMHQQYRARQIARRRRGRRS